MDKLIYKDHCWKAHFMAKGGNLVRLQWKEKEFDILRFPRSRKDYDAKPEVWGLPLLFLPNRIEDGVFTFQGRKYDLGINEAPFHNHLHGFLHHALWQIRQKANTLEGEYFHTPNRTFPHAFTVKVLYTFQENTLLQEVSFHNTGDRPMPFLFGQHSAFRLPEKESGIQVSCGEKRILLSDRHLPTGELGKLAGKSFNNQSGAISLHAWNKPEKDGFSGARITHPSTGLQILYKVDPQYKFWVLWNYKGRRRMFCPEPQTCSVNAPHTENLLPGGGNLLSLAPGEGISLTTSISVKEL